MGRRPPHRDGCQMEPALGESQGGDLWFHHHAGPTDERSVSVVGLHNLHSMPTGQELVSPEHPNRKRETSSARLSSQGSRQRVDSEGSGCSADAERRCLSSRPEENESDPQWEQQKAGDCVCSTIFCVGARHERHNALEEDTSGQQGSFLESSGDFQGKVVPKLKVLFGTLLRRADPLWSCKESREELDEAVLRRMRNTFWLTRIVFLRCLAFVYFVAFLISFNQSQGLIGSDGVLPAKNYVDDLKRSFADLPGWERVKRFHSLFLFLPVTDFWLCFLPLTGMLVSLGIIVLGGSNGFVMLFLWILTHTTNSVGQEWVENGWESLLLETGFLAIWMCPFWSCARFPKSWPTPWATVWGCRWLIYRVMIGAGLWKLRYDSRWRDLTAMLHNYETQPNPNYFAWYLHWGPEGFHKFETILHLFVECIFSVLVLIPLRQCRLLGGIIMICYQSTLITSGNFSFLNHLTCLAAIMCFDDAFLRCLFPMRTLQKLPRLVEGCGGVWSCPRVQAWPLDGSTAEKSRRECTRPLEEDQSLLSSENLISEMDQKTKVAERRKGRCCCLWYIKDIPYFAAKWRAKMRRLIRRQCEGEAMIQLRRNVWKILLEIGLVSLIVMTACFISNRRTYAIWEVIVLFFLTTILAAVSAFVTKLKVSAVLAEAAVIGLTFWSLHSIYVNGPEVWSIWLLACLLATLGLFAYTTLRNAALVFKIIVEISLLSLILSLSMGVVSNILSPNQQAKTVFESESPTFSVLNNYGSYGTGSKLRSELVIEGTSSTSVEKNTVWKEYEFMCKPGDVNRRPCSISPYHYRMDWAMWAASRSQDEGSFLEENRFMIPLLQRLLSNQSSVGSLFYRNPFYGERGPVFLRVIRYTYKFTDPKDVGYFGKGPWWIRSDRKVVVSPEDIPGSRQHALTMISLLNADEEQQRQRRKRHEEEEKLMAENLAEDEQLRLAEKEAEARIQRLKKKKEAEKVIAAQQDKELKRRKSETKSGGLSTTNDTDVDSGKGKGKKAEDIGDDSGSRREDEGEAEDAQRQRHNPEFKSAEEKKKKKEAQKSGERAQRRVREAGTLTPAATSSGPRNGVQLSNRGPEAGGAGSLTEALGHSSTTPAVLRVDGEREDGNVNGVFAGQHEEYVGTKQQQEKGLSSGASAAADRSLRNMASQLGLVESHELDALKGRRLSDGKGSLPVSNASQADELTSEAKTRRTHSLESDLTPITASTVVPVHTHLTASTKGSGVPMSPLPEPPSHESGTHDFQ